MIKVEVKTIDKEIVDAKVGITGEKDIIFAEYMSIVRALYMSVKEQIGEKDARSLLEEMTQKALDMDAEEVTREKAKQKFEEVKNDPEKVAKLLKVLFED